MNLLVWLITPPLAVLMIGFAVANRGLVAVSFDPLPVMLSLPLFLVVFLGAFLGLLAGGLVVWIRDRRLRQQLRRQRRELRRLEDELARAKGGRGNGSGGRGGPPALQSAA